MTIKRNDPCPCGSKKKYKKCCLNNANVIQIQEVKEERFFQSKQTLVLNLRNFLIKKIPPTPYYQLQSEFKKRTQYSINSHYEKGFFEFWLFFFHRFENGLRGIEWFVNENGHRLSQEESQMANTWQALTPKIVQAVNKEDGIIYFEDVFSKEQYRVPFIKDNVPGFAPWYGTFVLLEPFNDLFYFNGVRTFKDPNSLNRAIKKVQELVETTNQSREQVMMDFFPEILAALNIDNEAMDFQEREIQEYTLQYEVFDTDALSTFLQSNEQFAIDTWEEKKKQCSWVDNWYLYTDSELSGSIHLAEVYGKIFIENNLLLFNSLDQARVEEFKQIIQSLVDCSSLSLISEETNSLSIPFHAEIRDLVVTMDQDIPPYFALYAQNDILFECHKPIRQFNGLSIKELINAGRMDDVKNWLKQMEYNMYQQVHQQYDHVIATADYNTVRKELGLPLSPFVTGGENRTTTFERITVEPPEGQHFVKQEDIPYYEQLGFTPSTVDNFFSEDFVAFFKEKTIGKSDNTVRKYRSSLSDLRMILEQHAMTSWEECDQAFWNRVFKHDFTDLYEILTKTAIKDFISTTKALAKWLDQKKKTSSLSKIVVKVTKETEEDLIRSVEIVNIF